jgi:glycerol-3-phosphate dehydrogenase
VKYDLVVIGGGINGVGVAQAAAAAGHSVLLVEKRALAAGASSRSSKLIHGGLRYLESGNVQLVREGLRERRLLLRLAPDLVHLRPFHIPVYPEMRRRPWLMRLALSIYAVLGGLRRAARFGTVPRRDWEALDGLRTDRLQAVFRYYDAQTDDAALTAAVMKSAMSLGAELAMPAEFTGAELVGHGCRVDLSTAAGGRTVDARVMVNAAGAWVDRVTQGVRPTVSRPPIELVQGAHIVVRGQLERGLYYVESPRDGRAVFIMPWHAWQVLVGTTETRFRGDPDRVRPLTAEVHYLQSVLRHYFPRFAGPGLVDAFAGLRVLPAGIGHVFHRSRETVLDTDRMLSPRMLTITGGKLTSYRATAGRVMQRVSASLPARRPRARTDRLRLEP